MMLLLLLWLLNHHLPLCELGFGLVYGTLAALFWRSSRAHALAYAGAMLLALMLAACEVLAR
jgi:hypothetical protein